MHLLTRSIAVLTLLLATQACAWAPVREDVARETTMNGHAARAADMRLVQEKGAAMAATATALADAAAAASDAAADEASLQNPGAVLIRGGYAPLPHGPAVTADTLVEAIIRMATTFDSPDDMAPANVALVTALGMMPDSQSERTGIQGSIGSGHYEFAAWKRYKRHPGNSIELTVQPSESCLISFKSLHDPLVAAEFSITKSAVRFKPIFYFGRAVAGGMGLHVILSTDSHTDPLCVSRVRLEMEPIDG